MTRFESLLFLTDLFINVSTLENIFFPCSPSQIVMRKMSQPTDAIPYVMKEIMRQAAYSSLGNLKNKLDILDIQKKSSDYGNFEDFMKDIKTAIINYQTKKPTTKDTVGDLENEVTTQLNHWNLCSGWFKLPENKMDQVSFSFSRDFVALHFQFCRLFSLLRSQFCHPPISNILLIIFI